MIEGYKEQDRKAKRKIEHKNYITADWLLDRLNGDCENSSVYFLCQIKRWKYKSKFNRAKKI